jgi:hypothetical protein
LAVTQSQHDVEWVIESIKDVGVRGPVHVTDEPVRDEEVDTEDAGADEHAR